MDQPTHGSSESAPLGFPEAPPEELEQLEVADSQKIEEEATSKAVEAGTVGSKQSGALQQAPPDFTLNPILTMPPAQDTPQHSTGPVATQSLGAADADLIEKEWVVRAKAIVEKNKTDPYKESKEINKIKADYQKKRYNRELKIDAE